MTANLKLMGFPKEHAKQTYPQPVSPAVILLRILSRSILLLIVPRTYRSSVGLFFRIYVFTTSKVHG